MQIERLLQQSTRVLDIGTPNQDLAVHLATHEVTHYLGLAEPSKIDQIRENGPFAHRIQPLADPNIAAHSSTDVLIVRPEFDQIMWSLHEPIGARWIALERRRSLSGLEGYFAGAVARFVNRARRLGPLQLGDSVFDIFEVEHLRGLQPRMYFSPAWGPEGLAARLSEADLDYVVLRWFDHLPKIDPGEDLDILVADEDLAAFRSLVESEPGTQPLDLYSVSGLPYSDFGDAAYYPPSLARNILDRAVVHRSGFRVPAPAEHLHSLAYHAVYHKGFASGLPSENAHEAVEADHDYTAHLASLAAAVHVDIDVTLEGVDRYLAEVGWQPPTDALRRISVSNSWAANLLDKTSEELPEQAELTVFLIREHAADVISYDEIGALLDRFGFDLLLHEVLDDVAVERAASRLRGGNWGAGPFPRSGGRPVAIAVAVHHAPTTPYPWLKQRYPHLTNAEIYEAKDGIRGLISQRVSSEEVFNPIHSSDNTHEAFEYLAAVLPDKLANLRSLAADRASDLAAPPGAVRLLSRGRRARVDLVEGPHGLLVRKTFVRTFHRFLEREMNARRHLAGSIPAIPPLGDFGENWLDMPFYSEVLSDIRDGLLPLPLLRQMVDVLRRIHAAGYDVVDAKPANFIVDASEGLKLVDLEFLYKYPSTPPLFAYSANFVGPWEGFDGDVPVGDMSYKSRWRDAAGMPVDVLIEGGIWQQRLHRTRWALTQHTVRPGAPARRAVGRARDAARHQKWLVKKMFTAWARERAAGALVQADSTSNR